MDIVIPYKNSTSNGLELLYTLRGIERYFPGLENVFIVGDCPAFLQNVIHIPAPSATESRFKAQNILYKLLIACQDKRVSDAFAMFNDDHFLLKPWQSVYHYCGSLEQSIGKYTIHQTYRQTLVNTMALLEGGQDFDSHCPIVYQKELFIRTMSMADWSKPWGYGIKSLYCNLTGTKGEYYPDLKIKQALPLASLETMIADRLYFSIDDRALNSSMVTLLNEIYPQQSNYESD